jgi:integrase
MPLEHANPFRRQPRTLPGESGRHSARDVPIPDVLVEMLAAHRVTTPGGPADPVFPHPFTYGQAQKVFTRGCAAAELHDVRVHDLRHTFAVHAIQSGLPLPRLEKLLGHATPAMTMRYAGHAPEAYFSEDAARIAASLSGAVDREAAAVRQAIVQRADTA